MIDKCRLAVEPAIVRRTVVAMVLAAFAPALGAQPPAASADIYRVTWKAGAKAEVEAFLHSPTCSFSTAKKWATFFDDDQGWNRFHANLQATDAQGRPVALSASAPGEGGAHRFGAGEPCELRFRYEVDFAFGRETWSAGNEQVAWVDDAAVYTTGLPLFLRGGVDRPAEVEIVVPEGWSVATPWIALAPGPAETPRRYAVANESALLENVMVVGKIAPVTFRAGNLEVVAVLLGDLARGFEPLRDTFTRLAPRLGELFRDGRGDRRERSGRYLFAFLPGEEDGESYADSFGVSTRAVPTAGNRIVWANHLAHELIHFWIGKGIRPTDADLEAMQWFLEGFTEYIANRTLHEVGVFDDRAYFDRLGRHLGYYLFTRQNPNFQNLSPAAAGAAKWKNRPLVYSGGVAIALCLDARIREESKGQRSLDDLLGALADRAAAGERLTPANLLEAASASAGTDLASFFAKHVDGTDDLPIQTCAQKLGMRALVQGYDVFVEAEKKGELAAEWLGPVAVPGALDHLPLWNASTGRGSDTPRS